MFDIGFSELILVAVLALVVLGPKRLPEAARMAGRAMGKVRNFINQAKRDFDQELNTADMDDLRALKNELAETKRIMQQSSKDIYDDISPLQSPTHPPKHSYEAITITPPAVEDPKPEPAPKSAAVKRKRAGSSGVKKNGRKSRKR